MMTAAGDDLLNVEDVFSTYMFDGNSSTQTITNGLDLSTEGGLVIVRARDAGANTFFWDSEQGTSKYIMSASTQQSITQSGVTSFNTNGFTLGSYGGTNSSSFDYVSWSFRRAPKFFDIVTYTGTGSNQNIAHNLGVTPGFVMVKRLSGTGNWSGWHRDLTDADDYILLNNTIGETAGGAPTYNRTVNSSTYQIFGAYPDEGTSGQTYVMYLWAHNNGDGEFGPTGDQDIIKCGSYTGTGSAGTLVNIGFEPQWILIKRIDSSSDWRCVDVWRGMAGHTGTIANSQLAAKFNNTDQESAENVLVAKPNGFENNNTTSIYNASGGKYIYIAVRRPTGIPENGTDVFGVETGTNSGSSTTIGGRYRPGFSVDMALEKVPTSTDNWELSTRLISGTSLRPNGTNTEDTGVGGSQFDFQDGWNSGSAYSASYSWMWKRASGFFDVVTYKGNGGSQTLSHNLAAVPEMMWVKNRNDTDSWGVYHKDTGNTGYIPLNSTSGFLPSSAAWNNTTPTSTQFTVGSTFNFSSSFNYVAYLFTTLSGVSKVGSYTGNGTSQTIDCGFSSGARFVFIKRTSPSGNWFIWDTERGIVAGNDTYIILNSSAAQNSSYDSIDPDNSGFIINQDASANVNVSSATYIFYAVA